MYINRGAAAAMNVGSTWGCTPGALTTAAINTFASDVNTARASTNSQIKVVKANKQQEHDEYMVEQARRTAATGNVEEYIYYLNALENLIRQVLKDKGIKPTNKDIKKYAINVIRGLGYGGLNWKVTSGTKLNGLKYDTLRKLVNKKDPSVLKYFKENLYLIDNSGNKVDFIHMMATMSSYYYNTPLFPDSYINDLAGWGGDLQTMIFDLKIDTNLNASLKTLKTTAYGQLGNSRNFNLDDLYADIDAYNIYNLTKKNTSLSKAISTYYTSNADDRIDTFITKQGGLGSLEERAKDYTYGHESVKHELLYNAAFEAYLKSGQTESVGVSKDESSALTYAFIEKLKDLR
jgi:hypothetical protein